MGHISFNCPHCKATKATFVTHVSKLKNHLNGSMYATCQLCKSGVVLDVSAKNDGFRKPESFNDDQFWDLYTTHKVWPEKHEISEIKNLPPNVKSAFIEAEKAFDVGLNSAAAGMYRKTIERTLKEQRPDDKGMLNARIRKIEKDNSIPKHLVDLLDTIKFLGNEAMHEAEYDPTAGEVEAGREFTKLFLTYTYELPMKLEAALQKHRPSEG